MKIEVAIDSIVLDGYPESDAFGLRDVLSRHLDGLITERGLPRGMVSARALPATPAPEAGRGPDALGRALAASVYRTLGGTS